MKLGFLTACLKDVPLEELVGKAAAWGFQALEVSAWPLENERDYSGSSIDAVRLDQAKADQIKALFQKNNLEISSLAYYDNNLHPDPQTRQKHLTHLKKVIDAAEMLGVRCVGTFTGRDHAKTIAENLDEFVAIFPPLLDYAAAKGVQLMLENCPMPGWSRDGWPGTISYSPELWRELFQRIPAPNFGLNLDPSHLYWLGIDYLQVIPEFKERIFHTHAKDTVIFKEKLNSYGIYGKQLQRKDDWDLDWWSYRMPGRGEIDWPKFIATLELHGYQGVLSIEHEDPEYEGEQAKVEAGLQLGYNYLKRFL